MNKLDKLPVATIVICILVAIAAGVGGAVVILGHMTFEEYLDQLAKFAGAVGLLAIGRGIIKRPAPSSEATATVNVPKPAATPGPVSTLTAVPKKPPARPRRTK